MRRGLHEAPETAYLRGITLHGAAGRCRRDAPNCRQTVVSAGVGDVLWTPRPHQGLECLACRAAHEDGDLVFTASRSVPLETGNVVRHSFSRC